MKLLYISAFLFDVRADGTYALPSCTDSFFQKYLDVFDSVTVIGVPLKGYLDRSRLVKMQDPRITVHTLPSNINPLNFRYDSKIKATLKQYMQETHAVLIKPASRRGIMAIKLAEQLHKPYMIEMTGDIHNALLQSEDWRRKLYAPILYRQVKQAIKNCPFGLYVSEKYLQNKYPIAGEMCGCSDVVIETHTPGVLEQRRKRIDTMSQRARVDLALIGFYQGLGKGVDTAIRALGRLPAKYHLSILGNGTQENRDKWFAYAKQYGVAAERLHFPTPLANPHQVLLWLDSVDIFVLPTRSEGLSRCMVEAMSRGCPCLTTNICTMPELLPPEVLFPIGDDEQLAEKIIYLSNNPAQMMLAAQTNYITSKRFNFEQLRAKRNAFLTRFKTYCEKKLGAQK